MTETGKETKPPEAVEEHGSKRGADKAGPGKRASVRFVVVFVLLVGLFYVPYSFVSQTQAYRSTYLSLIAKEST